MIIVVEDGDLPPKRSSSEIEMENMRRQLELTENLLKAKQEEINFLRSELEKTKKEKDKAKKENDEAKKEKDKAKKEKDEAQKEIDKANNEKNEAKKEKDEAKKEKDEAARRLDAIYQLARPQGVKHERFEYVERFTSLDTVGLSNGAKREAEEDESQETSEKRVRLF